MVSPIDLNRPAIIPASGKTLPPGQDSDRISHAVHGLAGEPGAPVKQPQAPAQPVPAIDPAALEDALESVSENVQQHQRSLQFSIDESTGRTVIRVIDKQTNELIRQIPNEELLSLARHLRAASGTLFDDHA